MIENENHGSRRRKEKLIFKRENIEIYILNIEIYIYIYYNYVIYKI